MARPVIRRALEVGATASAFTFLLGMVVMPLGGTIPGAGSNDQMETNAMTSNHYVGLWVTGDGHIRHELLPNGRYVEARGNRERAYQGRYAVKGEHIDYVDDTGFTADGDFRNGILYHAGMVLYRD